MSEDGGAGKPGAGGERGGPGGPAPAGEREVNLVVREADGNDLEGVVRVGRTVMRATNSAFMEPEVVDLLVAKFWTTAANTDAIRAGRTFVAVDGREVVGLASFGRDRDRAIIWKLYVLPGYQGRGLGRRLVEAIGERIAAEYGEVYFAVHEGSTQALEFARAVGFEVCHTEKQSGMPSLVWLRRQITA